MITSLKSGLKINTETQMLCRIQFCHPHLGNLHYDDRVIDIEYFDKFTKGDIVTIDDVRFKIESANPIRKFPSLVEFDMVYLNIVDVEFENNSDSVYDF